MTNGYTNVYGQNIQSNEEYINTKKDLGLYKENNQNNIINNEEDAVASSKEDSNPLGTIVALSLIGVGGYLGYKSYKKSK